MTVGITHYAQEALGDIVFVSLPRVGDAVEAGQSCGEVESTKSVSELYAPMTGEVVEVNAGADDVPETINSDPYGEGWLFRIDCGDEAERNRRFESLMSAREYEGLTAGPRLEAPGKCPAAAKGATMDADRDIETRGLSAVPGQTGPASEPVRRRRLGVVIGNCRRDQHC